MSELKPGPVLDALVATEVMGWEHSDRSWHWIAPDREIEKSWSPSTSIADAWEVVRHLSSLGRYLGMSQQDDSWAPQQWHVQFRTQVTYATAADPAIWHATGHAADTEELAISLAALKAVGVEP